MPKASASGGSAPLVILLSRLTRVRRSGDGWIARCPAHEDAHPSLSVTQGDDGRALVKCFAGCTTETVLEAIGLSMADLFVDSDRQDPRTPRELDETVYDYLDENGRLLFQVCRGAGKRFRQRRPDPSHPHAWISNLRGVRRVLYRLPAVLEAVTSRVTVWIVEGEKDVHAIERVGGVATCNPGGAGKWRDEYSGFLQDATVIVVADADEPGHAHAEAVRASLEGVAKSIEVVSPKDGKDAFDHLAAGYSLDDFVPHLKPNRDAGELTSLTVDDVLSATPGITGADLLRQNPGLKRLLAAGDQTTAIVRLAEERGTRLFHDAARRAYATFETDGHRETWSVRSRTLRLFLLGLYYRERGNSPRAQAVTDAIATLESEAIFNGEVSPVHLRVAEHDGAFYLDLCDPEWRAVRITEGGWDVVDSAPVMFRRSRGMAPLPEPSRRGTLDQLRAFVNVPSSNDWVLLASWLLSALRPPGQPFPVLALHGEQGTAKSTTARVIRELTDPSTVPLRASPRDLRDLAISASNSWIVSLDNVSHLPPWLSDAICRLATGGGFATRELYADDEEVLFDIQRPVILNGIDDLATRSDLLDRAVVLSLPQIDAKTRREESSFWHDFSDARPALLGALLDAFSATLRNLPSVELSEMPRMADFARFGSAADLALDRPQGAFLAAYGDNRTQADELAIEASIIGAALASVAETGFCGTATELLSELAKRVSDDLRSNKEWPKNARSLAGTLRRLAPNLRAIGIDIDFRREARTGSRLIAISQPSTPTVTTVTPTSASGEPSDAGDGGDDAPSTT